MTISSAAKTRKTSRRVQKHFFALHGTISDTTHGISAMDAGGTRLVKLCIRIRGPSKLRAWRTVAVSGRPSVQRGCSGMLFAVLLSYRSDPDISRHMEI